MATKTAPQRNLSSKTKTDEIVKEIRALLDSGKSELDIIRHIAEEIDIPLSADPRLVCIKIMTRPVMFSIATKADPKANSLEKDYLDKAMAATKRAMDDFTQRNPYHAEYSFAAFYEVPSKRDQVWTWSETWHYGSATSATLWPWSKIKTALKDWLKEQPATKKHEIDPNATYQLVSGQCHVSVVDTRGKDALSGYELTTIRAKVKTSGKKIVRITDW